MFTAPRYEVLKSFDAIVTNVANSYRLQEECDVISLRMAKIPGAVPWGRTMETMGETPMFSLSKNWDLAKTLGFPSEHVDLSWKRSGYHWDFTKDNWDILGLTLHIIYIIYETNNVIGIYNWGIIIYRVISGDMKYTLNILGVFQYEGEGMSIKPTSTGDNGHIMGTCSRPQLFGCV